MLDGLLGRGFASKCKSLIKLTKTRIDVIRRKRNATQKFLRKDIADLLGNGLEVIAYGRADGLLVEVVLSSCYDFVEACCDLVLKHLSVMQKQRECPEECKAAVSSLMFAAARFSDLPELRDLRQLFYERFENSLEYFVNKDFVENLTSKPSTLENKVKLMKEIASEFSIKWDPRAFEQRMCKPSMSPQNPPKAHKPHHLIDNKSNSSIPPQEPPKAHRPFHRTDNKSNLSNGKDTVLKGDKPDTLFKERLDHKLRHVKEGSVSKPDAVDYQTRHGLTGNGYYSHNVHESLLQGRQEFIPDRQEAQDTKKDAAPKSVRSGSSSQGKRLESVDVGSKLHYGTSKNIPIVDSRDSLLPPKLDIASPYMKSNGKETFAGDDFGHQHIPVSLSSKDEVIPKSNPYYNNALPPPYVKQNRSKNKKHAEHLGSLDDGLDGNVVSKDPSTHNRANAANMSEGVRGLDHSDHERHLARPEKDHMYQDDVTGNPIPKPRSSRRRHSRSRSYQSDASNFEEEVVVSRKSRSKRRDDPRRGLQILFDEEHHQKDEEERMIDKLLIHYSKKPSAYEPEKSRRRSKTRHAHRDDGPGESHRNGSRDGTDKESEMTPTAARSVSLPSEHAGTSESITKVFTRAATFQQDRSNAAKHVHPKLPDYDDLVKGFAALIKMCFCFPFCFLCHR